MNAADAVTAPSRAASKDIEAVKRRSRLAKAAVRNALGVALVVEILLFAWMSSDFLTVSNFTNVAVQSSIIGLVAVTTTVLLIMGYVDLSIGSTVALSAVVAGVLIVDKGVGPGIAIAAGIGVGAAVGLINGTLVALLGFSTIIVTLGMLTAVRGAALGVTDATPAGFGDTFGYLARGEPFGVPVPVLIAGLAFVLGGAFLRYTVFGRYVYAIGVNREATYLSGISTRALPFWAFVATGASAGLGGVTLAARIDGAPAGSIGEGFELSVLTAVLLGGVAFTGGRGTLLGVFFGVLFLGILQNGLTLLNVSTTWSLVATGMVLVVAAASEYLSAHADGGSAS